MAANSPISRAGTRSRRPTGSSGLMAGTGRRSNPNASLPARTAGPSWRSISPESGSPCMRMAQPSFGKAMAPAKAAARHRARCTTSPSRSRKPTPPNGRWRPSASRSVSSSIGAARTAHYPRSPCPHRPSLLTGPAVPVPADAHLGFHPDDTTPIPRPSRYYGRRQDLVTRDRAQGRRELEVRPSVGSSIIVPASPGLVPGQIDKSLLTIAEPKRLRDKAHLRFVASQPCLVCGRQPSDPHHLRFAQPRALGLKVSDEFTVPLCRGHHRQLHQAGNEVAWWENLKIDALAIAKGLWEQTHPKSAPRRQPMRSPDSPN